VSEINVLERSGCPGARMRELSGAKEEVQTAGESRPSRLRQWPIQLRLVGPSAPYYQKADVLLVADCVAYAVGDFHRDYLAGHSLAIACPKLDSGQELYREKLTMLVDEAEIASLTVMIMQVPCCSGLLHLAQSAIDQATRKIPIKARVVGLQGEILNEGWVP
jgi:hypothetical protein